MKTLATSSPFVLPETIDIRQPEQAAKLSEAYAREQDAVRAALAELQTVRFVDQKSREATALATMAPIPGHALMDRAPREILRMRAALVLLSSQAHRRN